MLLWIILTAMTAAAAVWLTAPLLRRYDERTAAKANDLEVYRDQLVEVEREKALGLIDKEQAEASILEIKRRLLGVERPASDGLRMPTLGERHLAVATIGGLVVLGATILYSNMGRPDLPSVAREPSALVIGAGGQGTSFRPKRGGPGVAVAANPAQQTAAVTGGGAAPNEGAVQQAGSLDEMIQRLLERAKKEPGNADTWRMLGWSYVAIEKFGEAADAYAKAIAIDPRNAGLHAARGEALVRAGDGKIQGEAAAAFDAALAIDAKDPLARFFKGLADLQSGKKPEALEAWIALLRDIGPADEHAADLRTRITTLAGELKVDVSARLPAATKPGADAGSPPLQLLKDDPAFGGSAAAGSARGPNASDIKSAETMSATDRAGMIRGMVDKLAARLETSPRDADGWIQLIRSRKVLGEEGAAKAALDKAIGVFADAPQEQSRITAAAGEMGVTR
jgi:cytochrome c-type biogenesis protein CcmH